MALNLGSSELGVTVENQFPSCSGCPASNALVDAPERVWLSEPPTETTTTPTHPSTGTGSSTSTGPSISYQPQSLTLDFNQLSSAQPSVVVNTAGVYCWHSYSSNPKVISVHASVDGDVFQLVGKYVGTGKPSAGLILFALDKPVALKQVRFLRFDFEETYGGNQVYVNRLHVYESTPDVVKLFVDDLDHASRNMDGVESDLPEVSTPATMEAASMMGESVGGSLAKLQESVVYQYSSGLDDSLDDALSRSIELKSEQTRSARSTQRDQNGRTMGDREEAGAHEDPGFGVHLHRSGSMDIHIPSSVAGRSNYGERPTTHVRIHNGDGSDGSTAVQSTLSSSTAAAASSLSSSSNIASSSTLSSTSTSTSVLAVAVGAASPTTTTTTTTTTTNTASPTSGPSLSSWAISQAVRTPLSDQLHSMCAQVAELADRRGILDHNLMAMQHVVTTSESKEAKEDTEDTENKTVTENKATAKKIDETIPNNRVQQEQTHEQSDVNLLSTLELSLRQCAQQASSLEERVASVEDEISSLRQMMQTILERTGDHTTRTVHRASSPAPTTALHALEVKRVVVDSLKRWEKDMVTSVFDPSVRNAIRKFETKMNKRMSKLEQSVDKKQEKAVRQAVAEQQTAWAVGASMRTEQVGATIIPPSPEVIEQRVLVSRLQEKMAAKAKTLLAIETLQHAAMSENDFYQQMEGKSSVVKAATSARADRRTISKDSYRVMLDHKVDVDYMDNEKREKGRPKQGVENKDSGFGIHMHRSGSMDIHIPSTLAAKDTIDKETEDRRQME